MATQDHEVTRHAGPTSCRRCRFGSVPPTPAQVVTRDVVVHLHEAATAPAVDAPAHIIVSREPFTIKPEAGMGVYLWTAAGGPATVVITEAP